MLPKKVGGYQPTPLNHRNRCLAGGVSVTADRRCLGGLEPPRHLTRPEALPPVAANAPSLVADVAVAATQVARLILQSSHL